MVSFLITLLIALDEKLILVPTSAALRHLDNLRVNQADFEVLGRLGDGQFGVVNAVRCKLNEQVYATKTMKKFAVSRAGPHLSLGLERHIHLLAHAEQDPPIPELVFAFQTETSVSLVTTYADCGSLWDRSCSLSLVEDTPGRMSETEVKYWAVQMVEAIAWVHGHGFVHRDIKPHNFLVTSQPRLLLTDFGSAAVLQDPPTSSANRRARVSYDSCLLPVGTPDYIAPEILRIAESALVEAAESVSGPSSHQADSVGYDLTVDWWSLGATLYEMVIGKGPFLAPTIQETYNKLIDYNVSQIITLRLTEFL
ncbi:AGC/DMPK protein kinase [Kwoniella heveanensis CBS 569]|nr:AGC/DMPK protein kinase [Kwoniella heveanensis CBS 569]